jgi:hypothetical protein
MAKRPEVYPAQTSVQPRISTTENARGLDKLISTYMYLSDTISGNLPCRYGETPVEMMMV